MRAKAEKSDRRRPPVRAYGERTGEDSPNPTIDKPSTEYPTADEVTRFHKNADTDARNESLHHTLGINAGQAAPGNHTHDGTDSPLILEGVILTGSKTANPPTAFLSSVANALARLGVTDNST